MKLFSIRKSPHHTFYLFEKKILSAVAANLSLEARELFNKQINVYNRFYRENNGKEVNMYCIKGFKPRFDDNLRFPANETEIRLAKVKIKFIDDPPKFSKIISVEIWMVNGQVFSLTFSTSPEPYIQSHIEIISVEILADPMEKNTIKTLDIKESFIQKWVKKYFPNTKVEKIYAPLQPERIKKKIEEWDCIFPEGWIELMRYSDGFKLELCEIYGLHNARLVVLDNTEIIIIVEGYISKVLFIDRFKNNGHVYFMDLAKDTYEFVDYGYSFESALEKYLNGNQDNIG